VWTSPTGCNDDDNEWDDESNTWDGNTGTLATTTQDGYLQLLIPDVDVTWNCSRVRIWCQAWEGGAGANANITVQVYHTGAWQAVYTGAVAQLQWVELVIPGGTQAVSRARVRYNNSGGGNSMFFNEFMFGVV